MSNNVFILAAGLGTRLKPFTDTKPKALVPVGGKPLLRILIEKLKCQINDLSVVINIHHYGQQIIDYVSDNGQFGVHIQFSDERDKLLDTGGGIKKAAHLFGNSKPILIHNVDILSDIDLNDFYQRSCADKSCAATLLVSDRKTKRYLLFDEDNRLVGWTNVETGEVKSPYENLNVAHCQKHAFAGIHVISDALIRQMNSCGDKFSVIDFYLSQCGKHVIRGEVRNDIKILDVGKIDSLALANKMVETLGL